jgi:hypothetical protein
MCGGKTANASSYDDEIVKVGIRFLHCAPILPAPERHLMGNFIRTDVVAAQSGTRGRIRETIRPGALR